MAAGDPLRGSGGQCRVGPTTGTEVRFVRDYEYTAEFDTVEAGPYINRPEVDEVAGGEKGEMTINCDVREGGDAGQDTILNAKGTRVRLVFTTTGGKVLTFASALVRSVTITTEASGTQVMSFTIAGVAVITQHTP